MRLASLFLVAHLFGAGACEVDSGERSAVTFVVPGDRPLPFLETPWPSDVLVRRDDKGDISGLDLRAVPNPSGVLVLEDYLALFQSVKGYAASPTIYFRVPTQVDTSTLPTPSESLTTSASMFLVDVNDPSVRYPLEFVTYPSETAFLPAGALAVKPVLGVVLRGQVALVVTSEARDIAGVRLGPSDDMRALTTCEPLAEGKRVVDCAPYRAVREALGLAVEDAALVLVFTVQDAADELVRAADVVRALPRPTIEVTEKLGDYEIYTAYRGTVRMRIFQRGPPPFASFDGVTGSVGFDDDGTLHVEREEDVAFTLTVPNSTPPSNGFPVVLYAHGTGGDLDSGLGNGPRAEAHQIARAGAAMIATSEPLHEGRTGFEPGSEEVLTFNFLNPVAGRDNWRQSALEKMEIVSALRDLAVPWTLSESETITFDAAKVGFLGHSQGGNVGALFAAIDHRVDGVFLSGAGGGFGMAVVEKTEPYDISVVLRTLLSLDASEVIDKYHPVIALLQLWIEPADPVNYGATWLSLDDDRPHLVATSGLQDDFTPKSTHAGLAGGFRLPVVDPVFEPWEVLPLTGVETAVGTSARGNLSTTSGREITGAMLQYPDDGHFAIFNNAHGQDSYRLFFSTLFSDDVPEARAWMP